MFPTPQDFPFDRQHVPFQIKERVDGHYRHLGGEKTVNLTVRLYEPLPLDVCWHGGPEKQIDKDTTHPTGISQTVIWNMHASKGRGFCHPKGGD